MTININIFTTFVIGINNILKLYKRRVFVAVFAPVIGIFIL